MAVGDGDGTVRLLGGRDGVERARLPDATAEQLTQLAFTPAGDLVTAGLFEPVRVWRLADDRLVRVLPRIGPFDAIGFSPDARWVVTGVPARRTS